MYKHNLLEYAFKNFNHEFKEITIPYIRMYEVLAFFFFLCEKNLG